MGAGFAHVEDNSARSFLLPLLTSLHDLDDLARPATPPALRRTRPPITMSIPTGNWRQLSEHHGETKAEREARKQREREYWAVHKPLMAAEKARKERLKVEQKEREKQEKRQQKQGQSGCRSSGPRRRRARRRTDRLRRSQTPRPPPPTRTSPSHAIRSAASAASSGRRRASARLAPEPTRASRLARPRGGATRGTSTAAPSSRAARAPFAALSPRGTMPARFVTSARSAE